MRLRSRFGGFLVLGLLAFASLGLGGCGGTLYAVNAAAAGGKLEQARQLDGEHKATYEFYLAQERLQRASQEASEASYGDAIDLTAQGDQDASKAIEQARGEMSGAGRDDSKDDSKGGSSK